MLNWILSILVHEKILTEEKATELATKLTLTTHPANFRDAHKIVEKILQDIENKK